MNLTVGYECGHRGREEDKGRKRAGKSTSELEGRAG